MTFDEVLINLRDIINTNQYRIVYKYHPDIPWVFKFERNATQYDPIDVLYMYCTKKDKPHQVHYMVNTLKLKMPDAIFLMQVTCGFWKRKDLTLLHPLYNERLPKFCEYTGIKL